MASHGGRFSDCYGRGFERGEREAWADRNTPRRRQPPQWMVDKEPEMLRGWMDGYRPRNPAWALRCAPVPAFHDTAEA